MESRALWTASSSGDDSARDALLRDNLSLVHHVARQLSRSLAVEADFDELVSAGTLGLMTALKSFDPRRGNKSVSTSNALRKAWPSSSDAPMGAAL